MLIGIPVETCEGETRVAASPETVKKFIGQKHTVLVERGAGDHAAFTDEAYAAAGARLCSAAEALGAELVLKVRAPSPEEVAGLARGGVLIGMLEPSNAANAQRLQAAGVTGFALEAAPRVTRAQSMDVLSSQGNIAGYKAVMVAANCYQRFMPMLMTAAGTVKAARVLILGAGVAGLQAIATAKRLGAVIEASDVRPAVKEQIESLGAKFLDVPYETDEEKEAAVGVGGYAKPMPPSWLARQQVEVAKRIALADIVISTALIPGRADADHRGHGQVDEAGLGDRRHRRRQGRRCNGRHDRRQLPAVGGRPHGGQARRDHCRRDQPAGAGGGRFVGALCAQRARFPEADLPEGGRPEDRPRGGHRRRLPSGARRPGHPQISRKARGASHGSRLSHRHQPDHLRAG